MLPYVFGILALLVYAWRESRKSDTTLALWIGSHKTVMIAATAAMLVLTYFREVVTPILLVPVVLSIASAWLSGSLLNAIVDWITDAWNYLFKTAEPK